MSTLANQNCREDRERSQTFVSHLSPQEHAQVIRLVGRKCTVKCLLNGVETEALRDTGAQVSKCRVKVKVVATVVQSRGKKRKILR